MRARGAVEAKWPAAPPTRAALDSLNRQTHTQQHRHASTSDVSTLGGPSGTDTESLATSRHSEKNRLAKQRRKAAKKTLAAQRERLRAAAAKPPAANSSSAASSLHLHELDVEYVGASHDGAPVELKSAFARFATPEELTSGAGRSAERDSSLEQASGVGANGSQAAARSASGTTAAADGVSNTKRKKQNRLTVSELKQLVDKPELIEPWDTTASDPRLLVSLKSARNTVSVPSHWSQKRHFLSGKRGFEKPPFQLPPFIEATGIAKIRAAVLEKEAGKNLRGKLKERMQPKLGKIDVDYQVLHDAFFRYQTKPDMTRFGDLYYEGKELEKRSRLVRPGHLSEELRKALGMEPGAPPPWLSKMQRYGMPPSYPYLKIPGLNAPLPEGASYGDHPGGWGMPPVDEQGRPLHGDVFGTAPAETSEELAPGLSKEPWGAVEAALSDDESSDESEEEDAGAVAWVDAAAAAAPPVATAAARGGVDGDSQSPQAPAGSDANAPPQALYRVLEQQDAHVGGATFGSSHSYQLVGAAKAAGSTKRGRDAGVELALDPSELASLDETAIKARYEASVRAQLEARKPEDVSDIIAEQVRKQAKRKAG